ncbi:MAG: hydroxysqualene dehydroxylase HpnE [Phycisphaeraceae bacterium]
MNASTSNSAIHARRVIVVGGGLAGIAAAVRLAGRGMQVTLVETRNRLGGRATSFTDPQSGRTLDNCQHVLMGCCTNLIDLYKRLDVQDAIQWHRTLYFMDLGGGEGQGPGARGQGGEEEAGAAGSRQSDSQSAIRNPQSPRPLAPGPWPSLPVDILEADDLPAPLHMTRSLMAFKSLTLLEKLAISRGMFALMRLSERNRRAVHQQSFADWLTDHGQTKGAIDKFWAPVVISALNELPQQCAADYAIHVFQDGFLRSSDAYVMGLSRVPLVRLYDAAEQAITRAGGKVMLSTSAEEFIYENGQVTALIADGERLEADDFVSALPHDRLAKVCGPEMFKADTRLRRIDRFTTSPILGIHLWFECANDKPVMTLPHLVLMRSPLQWIFNKGMEQESGDRSQESGDRSQESGDRSQETEGRKPTHSRGWIPSQHLHGVISAAYDLVDQPADRIIELIVSEVRRALPDARDAKLVHARVVKEKRATFSPRPGVDAFRPAATGAIGNLYLAGDWCQSGWPATMEGAVRSGYLAAAALLREAGCEGVEPLVPDLEAEAMYRLING